MVSLADSFFEFVLNIVVIRSFCCLRSLFLLKMETPRMTSGFPPMKICWSRYLSFSKWLLESSIKLLFDMLIFINFYYWNHIYGNSLSEKMTSVPKGTPTDELFVCFMLCRLKMGSMKGRISWCLLCLRWVKSRSMLLRILAPRTSYAAAA